MRRILCILLVLLLTTSTAPASSEGTDLSTMMHEELQILRDAALMALIPDEIVAEEGAVLFDSHDFIVTYNGCRMDGEDLILDLRYEYNAKIGSDLFADAVLMRSDRFYLNGWRVASSLNDETYLLPGAGRKVECRIYSLGRFGISSVDEIKSLEFVLKLTETGIASPPIIAKTELEMLIYPENLVEEPDTSASIDLSSMSRDELRRLVDDAYRAMIAYQYPTQEDEVIYDDQGVKVMMMNWRMEDRKIKWDMITQNGSDSSITVKFDETAVNGWPKTVSVSSSLNAGKSMKIVEYIQDLGDVSIATMQDFQSLSFKVVVNEHLSDLITLQFAHEAAETGEVGKQAIQISAKGLIAQYVENVVVADMKYAGKLLRVNGTILQFNKSLDGDYSLTLGTDSFTVYNINCTFANDVVSQLTRLAIGDKVTITGMCQGAYSVWILMEDCEFVVDD